MYIDTRYLYFHDKYRRYSSDFRYLILINTVQNIVIQRQNIFQFIVRDAGLQK